MKKMLIFWSIGSERLELQETPDLVKFLVSRLNFTKSRFFTNSTVFLLHNSNTMVSTSAVVVSLNQDSSLNRESTVLLFSLACSVVMQYSLMKTEQSPLQYMHNVTLDKESWLYGHEKRCNSFCCVYTTAVVNTQVICKVSQQQ